MKLINLLRSKSDLEKTPFTRGAFFFLLVLGLLLLFPAQTFASYCFAFLASVILIFFLSRHSWGLYLMAGTCFFYGWSIVLAEYSWARRLPFLLSINAPLIDFISVIVLFGTLLMLLLEIKKLPKNWYSQLKWPMIAYGIFLFWALVSVRFAYDYNTDISFKFWCRFLLFSGLAFLVLPTWLAEKKEVVSRVLWIWWFVGTAVALFGLSSLAVANFTGWWRVTPYAMGGFAPLGYNHNLIAEVLVTIVPIGWYLAMQAISAKKRKWLAIGTGLMVMTALLTLSRAAWLSLVLEAIILGYFFQDQVKVFWKNWRHQVGVGLAVLLLILGGYMVVFLDSNVSKSSTTARLESLEMVTFYGKRSPIVGYGPGNYILMAGDVKEIVQEYGDPLDAHGWIQKMVIEVGLVGLVFWMIFLASVIWQLWRWQMKSSGEVLLLARAMLIMVVAGIFFQLFNTSYLASVMWLPIGIALAAAKTNE